MSHGHRIGNTKSPTYNSWQSMKRRCYDPAHKDYKSYGARGIVVCDRWLTSFVAFLEDMGPRPEGMTLDRRDPNGIYCKDNCRWADIITQANNRQKK